MAVSIRDRVKLLAGSYLEANTASNRDSCVPADGGKAQAGSRAPSRHPSRWWEEGSYWEFERAMDQLRINTQIGHKWFTCVYVAQTHDLRELSQRKRWFAEQSLSFVAEITRRRCDGNVYVPDEVMKRSEFANEVSSTRRPRLRHAA